MNCVVVIVVVVNCILWYIFIFILTSDSVNFQRLTIVAVILMIMKKYIQKVAVKVRRKAEWRWCDGDKDILIVIMMMVVMVADIVTFNDPEVHVSNLFPFAVMSFCRTIFTVPHFKAIFFHCWFFPFHSYHHVSPTVNLPKRFQSPCRSVHQVLQF